MLLIICKWKMHFVLKNGELVKGTPPQWLMGDLNCHLPYRSHLRWLNILPRHREQLGDCSAANVFPFGFISPSRSSSTSSRSTSNSSSSYCWFNWAL